MIVWEEILKFNNKHFPNWRKRSPIYYSNALAGEVGEICNSIKHYVGGGTKKVIINGENIAIEGVDVLIYLILLLERMGISRERFKEIFDFKMCILRRRMEEVKY